MDFSLRNLEKTVGTSVFCLLFSVAPSVQRTAELIETHYIKTTGEIQEQRIVYGEAPHTHASTYEYQPLMETTAAIVASATVQLPAIGIICSSFVITNLTI